MKVVIRNSNSQIVIGGRDNIHYPKLMKELREFFSLEPEGAYYIQQRTNYHGEVRKYFLTETGKLPTGFIPFLLEELDNSYPNLDVEIIDERGDIPVFSKTFLGTYNDIVLGADNREYQIEAIKLMNNYIYFRDYKIYFPIGIWDLATNAGKSIMALFIYLNVVNCRLLLLIDSVDTFNQLVREFTRILGGVGIINSRKCVLKEVTIAMAPTLYNKMKSLSFQREMQQFNTVIIDEGHKASGKRYAWVIKHLDYAGIRIVMSGTPMDHSNEIKALTVTGLGGRVLIKESKKQLMDAGVSKRARVIMHLCSSNIVFQKDYDYMYNEGIMFSYERIEIMKRLILENPKESFLITVYLKDHLQFIFDSLWGIEGMESAHGEDPERVDKLERFRLGDTRILISTEITKLGLNMPLVTNIIMAQGEKDKIAIKQWSGRGERSFEGEPVLTIHDFYDCGPYIENHSKKRMAIYKAEEFDIEYDYPHTPTGRPKKS